MADLRPKITIRPKALSSSPRGTKPKITIKAKAESIALPLIEPIQELISIGPKIIRLPHGESWLEIWPVLPPELRMDRATFQRVWNLHPTDLARGKIFGKEIPFPRWTQAYGQSYKFSGKVHVAKAIEDPLLIIIMEWIQKDVALPYYHNLLLNWYQDGQHYIGPHSDNETQLIKGPPIYSFSYGAEREFVIETNPKRTQSPYRTVIRMPNGSLIKMCGKDFQYYYKHSVPKIAASTCPDPRINITARPMII